MAENESVGAKEPEQSTMADLTNAQLADRTAAINSGEIEPEKVSKNAAKKAAKQEKLAAEKASKSATNTTKEVGRSEAKKAVNKAPKKKIEGAALIGIDVAKEDDFSGWYQQVLTKGDMLDYYDVSGCYILKVRVVFSDCSLRLTSISLPRILSGKRYSNGSTRESKRWESRTARFLCSSHRMCWSERKLILKALLLK